MSNPTGKGGFGDHKEHIWKYGRPKSFDALRQLAQEIAHEPAIVEGKDKIINGHKVTNAEAVLRKWLVSGNPQLQRAFMEIAFGKVPDVTQVSGPDNGPIEFIEIVRNATNDPNANNKE